MTLEEGEKLVQSVRFSGGLSVWKPRIEAKILSRPRLDGSEKFLRVCVQVTVPCVSTGANVEVGKEADFSEYVLSHLMESRREFKGRLFDLVHTIVLHELKEGFFCADRAIFNPHPEQPTRSAL